jgi:hypothetical protein
MRLLVVPMCWRDLTHTVDGPVTENLDLQQDLSFRFQRGPTQIEFASGIHSSSNMLKNHDFHTASLKASLLSVIRQPV